MPYLNQKAREVPPKFSSLTTSGLYVLFSKRRVYFWVGSDYQARYMSDSQHPSTSKRSAFVSDGLFLRLQSVYRSEVLCETEELEDQQQAFRELSRARVLIEAEETKKFMNLLNGKAS